MVGMRVRDNEKGGPHLERFQLTDHLIYNAGDSHLNESARLLPLDSVQVEIIVSNDP
jgi:hypothetical protein